MDAIEKEMQEIIKKNLPAQVGETLRKALEEGERNKKLLKEEKDENKQLSNQVKSANKLIEAYSVHDERNKKLDEREKEIEKRENNA